MKVKVTQRCYLKIAVFVILIFRLILLFYIPLLDKTEARYGEIARLMYETKQWIVLQIDYGNPFWAKPPLSTWLSAFSFEIFGINEFAVRLPSLIIAILVIYLIAKFNKKETLNFYLPAFILLTIPEFLIHAGVTSTDSALLFSITLTMLSFWKALHSEKKSLWSYLFFVGIGLGLLAKGPIIIVLTGPPIFIWCLLNFKNRIKLIWKKIPWILGILITLLISVPWYYFAEKETPGFIDYFIIGEHFKRYTESFWSGDRYGFAKTQPIGMIWLFLLGFAFPWIQIILYLMWKKRKTILKDNWVSFLILWLFWTPVFFTISRNAIHTYILPCAVPITLFIMHWWKQEKNWIKVSSVFPVLTIIMFVVLLFSNKKEYLVNADKYLLSNQQVLTTNKDIPVYYWNDITYSGRFYTQGKSKLIKNKKELDSVMNLNDDLYILIRHKYKNQIPNRILQKLKLLDENKKRGIYSKINQ